MRLAAIDIGTNSIHMVVARTTEGGGFEVVDREREVTQIGRGSFKTGLLQRSAMRPGATLAAAGRCFALPFGAASARLPEVLFAVLVAIALCPSGG